MVTRKPLSTKDLLKANPKADKKIVSDALATIRLLRKTGFGRAAYSLDTSRRKALFESVAVDDYDQHPSR